MKVLNIPFTDEEHKELLEKKGNKSWHKFILEKCLDKKELKEIFK